MRLLALLIVIAVFILFLATMFSPSPSHKPTWEEESKKVEQNQYIPEDCKVEPCKG